jgi:hypothetical protein
LPARQAHELKEQITAHLQDALGPGAGDQEVAATLRRLGSAAGLAAEAGQRAARPARSLRRAARGCAGGSHLDFYTPQWAEVAARAGRLGARRFLAEEGLVVFRSPGGLAFCVSGEDGGPVRPPAARWSGRSVSRVDQFCLYIPADVYDAECRFWADLTG